jgi:hypothetical protein
MLRDPGPSTRVSVHAQELVDLRSAHRAHRKPRASNLVVVNAAAAAVNVHLAAVVVWLVGVGHGLREEIHFVEVFQPHAPGTHDATTQLSPAWLTSRPVLVEATGARLAVRLVLRVPADNASMLLSANFEGTAHRLIPEKTLADFLLDLLRAQSVPLGVREVQVGFSPMLHKVAFLIEVLAAQVATARLAEVRCAGPLVPRANDSSAGDVLAANTLLLPQQVSGDLCLPPQDVVGCQPPAK